MLLSNHLQHSERDFLLAVEIFSVALVPTSSRLAILLAAFDIDFVSQFFV